MEAAPQLYLPSQPSTRAASRQVKRRLYSKAMFSKIPPHLPRRLRRSYARVAMKLAYRTVTERWTYPLTLADFNLNLRLRTDALTLAERLDAAA